MNRFLPYFSAARFSALTCVACLSLVPLASARDSLHLACVGRVDLGQGPQKFALTYDDERAGKMGEKRRVVVTLSLQSGNRRGYSDSVEDAEIHKVVLRNEEDKNDVLLRGMVRLVDGGESEDLQVDGDFFDQDKKAHDLHTKLTGYEVAGIWYGQNLKP